MRRDTSGFLVRALAGARKSPMAVVALFVVAGLLVLVAYRDLPIVRNALLYARIAYNLLDLGGEFQIGEHAYNKAVGFPFLAAPLVALVGANLGLKLASFLFTTLWAASAVFFFRRLAKSFALPGAVEAGAALPVLILLLNPLVFYQLLSAYPDTLSAAAILWALMLLDRITSTEIRWYHGVLFAANTLLAIWVKHHGFVTLALVLVFGLCRAKVFVILWRERRRELLVAALSIGLLAALLGLAQSGRVPLFNLARNKDNYGGGFGDLLPVIQANAINFGVYLLLTFSVLAPLLLRWRAVLRHKEWYLTLVVLVGTILVYEGASFNMRYFIPAAPLLVWIGVANLSTLGQRFGRWPPRLLLAIFVAVNLLTTLYYNWYPAHDAMSRVVVLPEQDNLRLTGHQRRIYARVNAINRNVTDARTLLFFANSYYGDGTWYVWERDGLFDERLEIQYMRKPYWGRMRTLARERGARSAILYTRRKLTTVRKPPFFELEKVRAKVYLLELE